MLRILRTLHRFMRRLSPSPKVDGKVRLHLGCGNDYWPGYVNIDSSQVADLDLCLDFSQIGEYYMDSSVAEVVMIHCLSYLRLWEARDLFKDIYRLLETSGRLIIELPDLAKCAQKVLDSEGNLDSYLEAARGIYAFDLGQIAHREMYTSYCFGWSSWHLSLELKKVGFRQVNICAPKTHGQMDLRDTRLEAVK